MPPVTRTGQAGRNVLLMTQRPEPLLSGPRAPLPSCTGSDMEAGSPLAEVLSDDAHRAHWNLAVPPTSGKPELLSWWQTPAVC